MQRRQTSSTADIPKCQQLTHKKKIRWIHSTTGDHGVNCPFKIALNTVWRCSAPIFTATCYDRHYKCNVYSVWITFLNPSVLTLFTSLPLIPHFAASRGWAPSVDCIAPLLLDSLASGTQRSLYIKEKWGWLWKRRAVSIYTSAAQLRNGTISFSPAYEAATTVLSMGTVVLSQVLDLFPARCQGVYGINLWCALETIIHKVLDKGVGVSVRWKD